MQLCRPYAICWSYHRDCGKRQSLWVGWGPGSYEINTVATNVGRPARWRDLHARRQNQGYTPRQISIARLYGKGRDSKLVFLTDDCCENRRPSISPDGKLFAWQTEHEGEARTRFSLHNIDGSNPRDITNAGNDGHPWFPRDGKWIVFESDRTGIWGSVEGTGETYPGDTANARSEAI